jgi:Cof subfamily protein (haloacid dehalogenase superfamily)
MIPPRLVAIDLDGTLLGSGSVLADVQLEACRKASENCAIVIATGRRAVKVRQLLKDFDFPHYLITCAGCHVEERPSGRLIASSILHKQSLAKVVGLFEEHSVSALLFCEEPSGVDMLVRRNSHSHPFFENYVVRNSTDRTVHASFADEHDLPVHYVSTIGEEQRLQVVHDELVRRHGSEFNSHLVRNISVPGAALDVLPGGVSKWSGIEALMAELGISREETAAIGDDMNDYEMIANAGIGIAMANAREEIRAIASAHTKAHNEDGVAWALANLLKVV